MGGWDPITPLKPLLGPGFSALVARLQAAVDHRYDLPAWTPADHALHKRADRLAAGLVSAVRFGPPLTRTGITLWACRAHRLGVDQQLMGSDKPATCKGDQPRLF